MSTCLYFYPVHPQLVYIVCALCRPLPRYRQCPLAVLFCYYLYKWCLNRLHHPIEQRTLSNPYYSLRFVRLETRFPAQPLILDIHWFDNLQYLSDCPLKSEQKSHEFCSEQINVCIWHLHSVAFQNLKKIRPNQLLVWPEIDKSE